MRVLNEKTQMAATKPKVVVANPIKNNDMAIMMKPAVIGTLLSYRDTSHPEMGSPIKELIGMNSKIVPS